MKVHGRVWMGMLLGAVLLAGPRPSRAQFSPGKLSRAHSEIGGPTACFRCHEPRKSTTPERCLECHRELASRIAARSGFHGRLDVSQRTQCSACHAEHGGEDAPLVRWPGGQRRSFDHRRTGFALSGKHATLGCDQCHRPNMIRAADVRGSKNLRLDHTHLGLSTRCAACHTDAHHGQFEARVAKKDCAGCHTTTGWKAVSFDHATANFKLDGKHAALACNKCHVPVNAAGARVAAGSAGAFVRYRPIESSRCTSCHTDPHRERFGNDCTRCHSPNGWKQLARGRFDHSKTRFPLVGRHRKVNCSRCHHAVDAAGKRVDASTPGSKLHYRPIAHAGCTDCHRDPHRDRFGRDCTRCHSPAGWNTITAGAFDHDRTRYPLRGRHAKLACAKCHRARGKDKALAFAACSDCHADSHRGQLARRSDRGACESCHSVAGFSPARFGPQEHAAARFSLQGAHRAVACVTCHRPSRPLPPNSEAKKALAFHPSNLVFRFKSTHCSACHRDPHAGQFADAGGGGTDCKRCHGLTTWRLSDFDHAKSRFPLEGAHRRTACASCHRPVKVNGRDVARYRPLETACRSCHAEPVGPLGK